MADYLNEYKDIVHKNPQACFKYSDKFFDYLLSQCWRKMYRRISSLPAIAFTLGLVDHWSTFQANIAAFKWDDPEFAQRGGDRTLASCILSSCKSPEFTLLQDVENQQFEALLWASKSCVQANKALYTKDSAESFHRFLFATLVMYAISINDLQQIIEDLALELTIEEELDRLRRAKGFTRILTNILSSSTFKHHMRVITLDGSYVSFLKANLQLKEKYRRFVLNYRITWSDPERHPEQVPEPQDYRLQGDEFTRWARSIVAQFIGKRALEKQAARLPDISPEISVIEANRMAFRMPSWPDIFKVLIEALQGQSTPVQEQNNILEILRNRIMRPPRGIEGEGLKTICQIRRLYFNRHPLTWDVQKIKLPEDLLHSMTYHCEAVMAALSEYGQEGVDHILEVRSSSSLLINI